MSTQAATLAPLLAPSDSLAYSAAAEASHGRSRIPGSFDDTPALAPVTSFVRDVLHNLERGVQEAARGVLSPVLADHFVLCSYSHVCIALHARDYSPTLHADSPLVAKGRVVANEAGDEAVAEFDRRAESMEQHFVKTMCVARANRGGGGS